MRSWRARLMAVLVVVALAYAAWLAFLWAMQDRILYPGAFGLVSPAPSEPPEGAQVLERRVEGGQVVAWLLPPMQGAGGVRGMVVHFHGNAERIESWAHLLSPWRRAGYWVLLPEYRGYGQAAGRPSQAALVEDAAAFVAEARSRIGASDGLLVYHGRSLGGAVAAQVSLHETPSAVVLESTFTRLADLARPMLVPPVMLRDGYDSLRALQGADVPLLLLHGRSDEIIPFRHAERLSAALPRARLVPMACGHNDCPDDPGAYWRAIFTFMEEVGP